MGGAGLSEEGPIWRVRSLSRKSGEKWGEVGVQTGEEWRGLQETLVCSGRGLEDLCQGKKAGISGWASSLGGEVGGSDGRVHCVSD